jgi:hypothetical protein
VKFAATRPAQKHFSFEPSRKQNPATILSSLFESVRNALTPNLPKLIPIKIQAREIANVEKRRL